MINVHYSKRIRNPFTTSFSNADTPSSFWREFQYHFYTLTREYICLTLQGVITGILYTNCPMLNSLLLIAKLYLRGCRRNQTLPNTTAFSSKVKIKYETEKFICVKTNKMDKFNKEVGSAFWLYTLVRSVIRTYFFLYSYFSVKVYSVMQCNVFVMYCNAMLFNAI